MKNVLVLLMILAIASWANAAVLWSTDFEDGTTNLGGADSTTVNGTAYAAS
jgi:hypothetical protein